jgi:hypothetical protein
VLKKAKMTNRGDASDRDDASDAEAFEQAMLDVVCLKPDPRGRVRVAPLISTPT